MNSMRRMVSKKKKRFVHEGFDLDLSYITDRIISMGFPSSGVESMYRNPMPQVQKFLEARHKNHYKVYNLCAEPERVYAAESFCGRVERFHLYDHMAPPLDSLEPFCRSCKDWLDADEQNVVAVHCKAGKGRAGTMICMLLLYMGHADTAEEAMKMYGDKRTHDGKGVTIPSQKRYVRYWEHILKFGTRPETTVTLKRVRLRVFHMLDRSDVWCMIKSKLDGDRSSKDLAKVHINWPERILDINFDGTSVRGDVMVILYNKKMRLFHFWFNTAYVDGGRAIIPLKHLDRVNKKGKFNKRLAVELQFDGATPPVRINSRVETNSVAANGDAPSNGDANANGDANGSGGEAAAPASPTNPTSSFVPPSRMASMSGRSVMSDDDDEIDIDDAAHGYSDDAGDN